MDNGSHTGHMEVMLASLLTVGTGIVTLALVAFLWSRYRCKNTGRTPLPPGPRGVPLLGYLPFLRGQRHKAFRDIADKYGAVFRIKLGAMNVVVLNDFESISEGYSKLLGRPKALFLDHAGLKGLANLNGRPWVENRRFCVRSITSGSYGGKTMNQQIEDEAVYLARKISDTKGAAINAGELLLPSVSNNVTVLVLGARYDFEDKRRTFLDGLLVKAIRCFAAGALVTVTPIGLRAVTTLFFTKLGQIRRITQDLRTFFSDELAFGNVGPIISSFLNCSQEVVYGQASGRQENSISFIEDYKQMIANENGNPNSCFKDEFLLGNILTLFGAGSQTTYQTVVWHLLNLADKVDTVQRKIRDEVDLVVGRNRPPRWEDRHDMPYTMASIWELYRWRTPALLGIPRQAEEDVVVGQYLIPAGTIVISNIWATHMDPERWTDPEQFKPERFLTDDGSALIEKPENLIAFSIGKRMCPAEPLANAQVFVYTTLMVQRFVILPEEGKSIDLSFDTDGLCVPRLQHLRFMKR